MSNKPRVIEVKQTDDYCPSQWEGTLEDGKRFYIRYRWGTLSVSWLDSNDRPEGYFFSKSCGGPFDGVINTEEMVRIVDFFDWSICNGEN